MTWINAEIEHVNWLIKNTRNFLNLQFGLLLFNIGGILFNWYILKVPHSQIALFGMGAFTINTIISIYTCISYIKEIRDNKDRLKDLQFLETEEAYKKDREEFLNLKKKYEDLYIKLLDENIEKAQDKLKKYSQYIETPTKSDTIS